MAKAAMPYGYLLKPVEAENIFATIEVALSRFSVENTSSKNAESLVTSKSDQPAKKPTLLIKDALFLKDEYQYVKIMLSDIEYIKSNGNYVEIHGNGKKKVLKETLKSIESKLPSDTFFQVHRSFIVNVSKIQSIGGASIKINEEEIPIVKEKKDLLLSMLAS